jgi:hypothetical protein
MARRNQTHNPSTHPFSIKAHGGEAGNVFELEDSDGNVNFSVDADGNVVAAGTLTTDQTLAVASADGAITAKTGVVVITKATAAALTIAAPTDVTDDGKQLLIVSSTAAAHTVTNAAPGFNGGGAGEDVATFGAAKGNAMRVVAYGATWYAVSLTGVTLA